MDSENLPLEPASRTGVCHEKVCRYEPPSTVAVWRDPFGNRWDLIEPARPEAQASLTGSRLM